MTVVVLHTEMHRVDALEVAFVEGVLIFDADGEQRDMARTRLHRGALAILCGAESVAALEALAAGERRIATAAWVMTGGDVSSPRIRSLLHVLDGAVAKPKPLLPPETM